MTIEDQLHGFQQVDANQDPALFIQVMDRQNRQEQFQAVKAEAFRLLAPQPGEHMLEAGCGTGEDAQTMARLVGPNGDVDAVDGSEIMLAEARTRATAQGLTIAFQLAQVDALPFDDGRFDGCHSDRVLQHVESPVRALREMARVTRSGGRVVVSDTDWGMIGLDLEDRDLVRRILTVHADVTTRDGWIGRQLPRLFADIGLQEMAVVPHTIVIRDYELGQGLFAMMAARAREAGAISDDDVSRFLGELQQCGEAGRLFAALTMFTVAGRKQ